MLKLKKVYICDHCGAVALQERYCFMEDSWTGPPDDWGRVHNMDLCPKCYQAYKILKKAAEDFVKEKMEEENES